MIGRVDRIGAKGSSAAPSASNLPYIAESQYQKMYQVVTDRERWFNVVMSHKFLIDDQTTEAMATRIPLPGSAAAPLAMRLEVVPREMTEAAIAGA